MPYRRKDSPVWWATYTDASGKRVRRSTGTTDRTEAAALEGQWRAAAFRQTQWGEQPPRTFEEVMLGYLQATQEEKRSAKDDRLRAKTLREFFGGRDMNSLRAQDVRSYIDWRKGMSKANATVNRELALLSSAINFGNREWDWDLPNPVRGRKLREPEGRVRWLTSVEAAALLRAASQCRRSPHLADFITLALNTGCRRGELLGLEWSRVDLPVGLIHLHAEHTKAKKRRSIPLNMASRAALVSRMRFRARHCPASPWVFARKDGARIRSIKESFSRACAAAGIEDFRIHDLRHTAAAWLVSAGAPLAEIRDLLGHSTVMMTERYAHLAPDNLRGTVALLEDSRSRFGHAGPEEKRGRWATISRN